MNKIEDFEKISEVLGKRKVESIAQCFLNAPQSLDKADILIATAPSDLGVCRNGGRRGASFGPEAILSVLKKMAGHPPLRDISILPVSFPQLEEKDFAEAQQKSVDSLISGLKSFNGKIIVHIGGGHDHAYPMLKALESYGKKILAINIDAHMDTRDDSHPHSGTPFRQFAAESAVEFKLIELGIHNYANTESTMVKLPKGEMQLITTKQFRSESNNFSKTKQWLEKNIPISSDEIVYLSLDCDAIDAGIMEGVSAVNHDGLSLNTIKEIFSYVRNNTDLFVSGLYEYNPVYDNLGQRGARALASLIYEEVLFPRD